MISPDFEQPVTACDLPRIRNFLEADHYHLEDSALIAHLDACPSCREYLESETGEAERWSQATELLKPTEFDQAGSVDYSAATCCESSVNQPAAAREVLDSLVPSEDPNHLGRLGTYEVTGVVGVGGMGVVLKAVDPSLDRIIAVKVMSPRLAHNENARKRFAREAKAAAAVLHPNVIPIHSVSSGPSLPYLVMSYIRGGSLQKRLEQEGALPLVEVLRIGSQIAAGLEAAHEQGLVHRDIKPENILLEEGVERVTITDFGLARSVDDNTITQLGSIAGTPQYMSPEQAQGEPLGQQSDLFSLGSVLYSLCTGRPPFRDDTSYGVMRKIIDEAPTPIQELNPEMPDWMVAVVEQLMAKQKENRFNSAREVHEILEACLSHVQQPTANPLPASLLNRRNRRAKRSIRKFMIGAGAIAMVLSAAFVVQQATRPYSATQFGKLRDRFNDSVTQLPGEQPSVTSGRVTFGDRQRLLGYWEVIKVPLRWKIQGKSEYLGQWHIFDANSYSISTPDVAISKGEWELDDKASPRRIVLRIDGAERKALYKVEGDFLTLFYRDGEEEFPAAFPSALSWTTKGVLLILQHTQYVDVACDYSDLTPGEAELLAKHQASVRLTNLADLTPQTAAALATGTGNLDLPAVRELTPETARALAAKKRTWLSLWGLRSMTLEVAEELATSECALDLGVKELSVEAAVTLASHSGSLSLNGLNSITPAVSQALARTQGWLQLNGLKSLDIEVAAALSEHRGWLSLNGLDSLTSETAEALQAFRGENLDLNGIRTLDIETAEALVKVVPSNQLGLNGLTTLSPEVAATLVSGGHRYLSLQGLETLPEESLKILRRHQRRRIESNAGGMLLPVKFALPQNH